MIDLQKLEFRFSGRQRKHVLNYFNACCEREKYFQWFPQLFRKSLLCIQCWWRLLQVVFRSITCFQIWCTECCVHPSNLEDLFEIFVLHIWLKVTYADNIKMTKRNHLSVPFAFDKWCLNLTEVGSTCGSGTCRNLLRLWTSDRFELLDIQVITVIITITINSHLKWR